MFVIPLGELSVSTVERIVRWHFGAAQLTWLDRAGLRREPLRTLSRVLRQPFEDGVLVAADLASPRLRLTSLLLGVPRAARRSRMDLHGNRESWSLGDHLRRNALPILRHSAAFGVALALHEPLLASVERVILRRLLPKPWADSEGSAWAQEAAQPRRLLYLRSQLWLNLMGGGSVAHTAGVIGGLEQSGVQVDVVASDRLPGVSASTTLVKPETWFDGWRREVEDLVYNVAFFRAARRVARHVRPQVIYQRHTAFNCSGALLARCLRVPLVLEFNSSELWKGRYWGGLRLVGAAARVERINLRAADLVVVISETLRKHVQATGVPAEKIVVNPNGVDPAQFRPDLDASDLRKRLGIQQDELVLGFSGTFGEWHGIPTLADTLPLVLEARPSVRWLLIGDGPLRRLVDQAVQDHGMRGRVLLTGLVPHAEMPEYLAACDVLVSPHGRQADGGEFFGSPTKLYEYMAAGRPIVASAVGQIAEVLEHERSALLVEPDNAAQLTDAIVRLVDDAPLRNRLGRAARERAIERHTWRQNAQRLLAALATR